ncbi:UNKNOWN [Stylonychia lemnae]|uniref:Uncharacterized protein n=1 Tax=Stylonychia lemnae TaxID=5949 RepID=A0A077ZWC2_STYLE|nr:UNKNOWN [Stylonychia lemnae]|eukprot:CDW74240.1 UNKNOWN [Stylonychia lemnae]
MSKKIETYANEKVAFYLHKNRNFIHKIENTLKEIEKDKKIKMEKEIDQLLQNKIKKPIEQKVEKMTNKIQEKEVLLFKLLKWTMRLQQINSSAWESSHRENNITTLSANTRYQQNRTLSPNKKINLKAIKAKLYDKVVSQRGSKFNDKIRNDFRNNVLLNKLISSSQEQSILSGQFSSSKPKNLINEVDEMSNNLNQTFNSTKQSSEFKIQSFFPQILSTNRARESNNVSLSNLNLSAQRYQASADTSNNANSASSSKHQTIQRNMVSFKNKDQILIDQENEKQKRQIKGKIKHIIERCLSTRKQAQQNIQDLEDNLEDLKVKEQSFSDVFHILREIEGTDASVIESLYVYKMNGQKDFQDEAKQVTKEFKLGMLDPMREVTKYEQQMRFKKRKDLLKGTIKIKAGI